MLTSIEGTYKNGQIILKDKPDIEEEEVQVIVTFLEKPEEKSKKRIIGSMKGLFEVPDDFDEPLDDLKEYHTTIQKLIRQNFRIDKMGDLSVFF